jgi:oligosaccharide repeat unit polymerase
MSLTAEIHYNSASMNPERAQDRLARENLLAASARAAEGPLTEDGQDVLPAVCGVSIVLLAVLNTGTLGTVSFVAQSLCLLFGLLRIVQRSFLGLLAPSAVFFIGGAAYSIPIGLVVVAAGFVFDQRDLGESVIGNGAQLMLLAYGCAMTGYGVRQITGPRYARVPLWMQASSVEADGLVGLSLLVAGCAAIGLLLVLVGGPSALLNSPYGERYLLLEGLGPLAVGFQVVLIGAVVSTATMLRHQRTRAAVTAAAVALTVLVGWMFVSGSRNSVFQLSMGMVGVLQASGRGVRGWVLLTVGSAAMLGGLLYGTVRGSANVADSFASAAEVAQRLNPANQEFGAAAATVGEIVAAVPTAEPYQWGATIPRALGVLVPRAIWPGRPESLPEWYVRRFYPDVAAVGGGYAFSTVAEAWLNFGIWGVVVGFALLGALIGAGETYIAPRTAPWPICIYASLLPWLFAFSRLDSGTMLKSVGVNVLAVLLVAFVSGRVLVRVRRLA